MVKEYKTIYQDGIGEIVEKKSRFICHIFHVNSQGEAEAILERMRKKYWDATHNCYAYCIGKKQEMMRCSDDGEPAQTAGRPMLDVLVGQKLCDVMAVVTRYFGGTLLGTGGLVRAYGGAVKEGLNHSVIVEKKLADLLKITVDYTGIGKIQYLLGQEGLVPTGSEYGECVKVTVPVPVDDLERIRTAIKEGTNGKAQMEVLKQIYYGNINGTTLLFEE